MSKFQNVKGGKADDLGNIRYRSTWERNVRRILDLLTAERHILAIEYEKTKLSFVGGQYRRNTCYLSDFRVIVSSDEITAVDWFIEVKGMLRRGGRLAGLDLSSIRKRDHDSYVKLTAVQKQYPQIAKRMLVIGEREYRWLERRYAHRIPTWEARRVAKSSRQTSGMSSSAA